MNITISASEIKQFRKCPWRYFARQTRIPKQKAVPLTIGTMWHSFTEAVLRGGDVRTSLATLKATAALAETDLLGSKGTEAVTKFRGQVKILEAAAMHWTPPPSEETLTIEEAFTMPLGLIPGTTCNLILNVRPDTISRVNGSLWHDQRRTLNPGITMSLYQRTAVRDLTERLYHAAIKHRFPGEDVIGTRFDILRKLSPATINARPQDALGLLSVVMEQRMVEDAIRQLKGGIAKAIYMMRMGQLEIWDNDDEDRGSFGNSEDSYFRVLSGETNLEDDNWFEPALDRYSDLTVED
jgi:hypothetical protein